MSGQLLSANTLIGDAVKNRAQEDLGSVKELMIDIDAGRIAYAVVSFGGLFGIGDKLFAVPWSALQVDTTNKHVVLDVAKETLENAPGFDKDNWPDMANRDWGREVHWYYNQSPYWD
ncbi:MAG: PRC-barrel domain containing protein [Chloroflexi bacterium]|nr:PRC-barrel domain containing protein [Chloroflexota bacterium]